MKKFILYVGLIILLLGVGSLLYSQNTSQEFNGPSGQSLFYNVSGANYERGFIRWDSNIFKIGTEVGGSGTLRSLELMGYVTIDTAGSINIPTGQAYKINNTALAYGDVGAEQAGVSILKSVIAAADDVLVGTAPSTPGVITKGANNTLFGVNNSGTLGFFASISLGDTVTFFDTDSVTKIFKFDASLITAGQTRTITVPDRDITLAGLTSQTVIVAKTGGEYTSIQAAINYAVTQTPSATNLWTVVIMPGVYTEAITMSSYVSLMGVGTRSNVVIFQNAADVITLADHVEVQNLTVRVGTGDQLSAFKDNGVACTAKIIDVNLESLYVGINAWTGFNITGAGNYTIDHCSYNITTGLGDDGGITINGAAATVRITNCDFYMAGATGPPTSSKSHLGIVGSVAATIISSGNRYDGDVYCNMIYAESGTIISTYDAILTQYGDQIDPAASVTAGNQKLINTVATGLVATIMTNLGPTGAQTTIQGWIQIKDSGGTTRYIPYW